MIQINEKKYQRQQVGQQRWKDADKLGLGARAGWGAWEWVTAMGKTFATCDMIRKMVNHNTAFTFKIIVPGPEILKQWKDAIYEIIEAEHHNQIEILTIHKTMEDAQNGLRRECTLLVLDEMHEYYSDERIKIFHGAIIDSRWCLGLTANYEDIHKRHLLIQIVLPVVDSVSYEEALKEGYISKYFEYNLGISLSANEKAEYDKLCEKVSNNLSKLGKNGLEAANKILSGLSKKDYGIVYAIANTNGWRQNMNLLDPRQREVNDLWAPAKIIGYASNGINAVRERKNIIYNSIAKINTAVELITKLDNLKTICFSQTTLFADSLAKRINEHYKNIDPDSPDVCVVYHSNLATKITEVDGKQKKKGKTVLKREAIEAIKNNTARVLSTASALDKGLNIEDIELAVTTSGTQNPTQYNQRKGRSLRVMEGKDKIALVVNIYARNTIDEKWLRKRQSKSNNVVYYVASVNDISYNPVNKETFNIQEV